MFDKSFFPTPRPLLEILFSRIKLSSVKSVLEPSAGKGNIIDFIKEKEDRWNKFEIEAIELNDELRGFLKAKDIKVIYNDFLNFDTYRSYDLIVLNPPFDKGEHHLMKAINIQETNGGQIACILGAHTIKNPWTKEQKKLIRLLNEYDAQIEYYKDMFLEAERKTSVEVAVIWINIPKKPYKSFLLENIKKTKIDDVEPDFEPPPRIT